MRRRLRQMRWRIAASYITLIVLALAALSIIRLASLRDTYLETLEAGLTGQARLVAAIADPGSAPTMEGSGSEVVNELSRQLNARVTLIAADGTALADSSFDIASFPNMLERPEVRDAALLGHGANARLINETGESFFFVAVPIGRSKEPRGFARVGVPLTMVAEEQRKLAVQVATTAVVAVLVALILAILIARRMTRPLLDLRLMANRLAAGELDAQVPIPADDDVASLAQSFNLMASQLREVIGTLETERSRLETVLTTMADGILMLDAKNQIILFNRAARQLLQLPHSPPLDLSEVPISMLLLTAIREIRASDPSAGPIIVGDMAVQDEARFLRAVVAPLPVPEGDCVLILLQDLTDLRRAEHARRTFLANISHDLRTPLTSLQAMIETLHDGALQEPEVAQDFLVRMDAEVHGLSRLVNEFLELSRLDAGQISFHFMPTDVAVLLAGALSRMDVQARQLGVALSLELPGALPLARSDPTRIEQVLLNLLQNALAFTPSGGAITLSAVVRKEMVEICVRDNGAGIPPEDLPHIFDRFYKADRSRSSRGTGLGLSIARQLIDRHGGRIWVESQLHRGTAVFLTLPISRV